MRGADVKTAFQLVQALPLALVMHRLRIKWPFVKGCGCTGCPDLHSRCCTPCSLPCTHSHAGLASAADSGDSTRGTLNHNPVAGIMFNWHQYKAVSPSRRSPSIPSCMAAASWLQNTVRAMTKTDLDHSGDSADGAHS